MKPPAAFTAASALLRLATSVAARPASRTPIGRLQAGVLRRERPGSPNTRFAKLGKVGEVLIDESVAGAAEARRAGP